MTGRGAVDLVLLAGVALCCLALTRDRAPVPRLLEGRGVWRKTAGSTDWPRWLPHVLGLAGAVVLGSPMLAVAVPLAVAFVRRELIRRRRGAAMARRADMVVALVVAATSGLRAGRSLSGALLGEPDAPGGRNELSSLQRELVERVRAGRPLVLAVEEVLGSGSVDERLIATTIRALDATGASASTALERVAEALGERQSSREDARTQAQHALSSAGVLAALPFVFGMAAALADPDVGRLYLTTWLGAACVSVALVLIFGSWEWLQRLLGSARA